MTTIITFGSSLLVVITLVSLKAFEISREKRNFFLSIVGKLDEPALRLTNSIRFRIFQIVQSVRYIILVKMRDMLHDMFVRVSDKIASEYRERQDMLMGRREIANKGAVSFYLKKITEDKSNGEKGKIEESLPG